MASLLTACCGLPAASAFSQRRGADAAATVLDQAMAAEALTAQVEAAKVAGNAHYAARRFAEALAAYEEGLALDADNVANLAHVLRSNVSAVQLAMGRADAAKESALQTIALDPDWARGWERMGRACSALGEHGDAVEAFETLVRLAPGKDNEALLKRARGARKSQADNERAARERAATNVAAGPAQTRWAAVPEAPAGAGAAEDLPPWVRRALTRGYSDGDGEDEGEDEDEGCFGFTADEVEELLEQGVKPWDPDASAVLAALRDDSW